MENEAAHSAITLAIGGGVGTLCRFLMQSGLHGRWASILAGAISFLFVAVFALDAGDFARGQYMRYLLAWVEVLAIAAGALKTIDVSMDKLAEIKESRNV